MYKATYRPLFGYNIGIHGPKPSARIIAWEVVDFDGGNLQGNVLASVVTRREARNIVSTINGQQRLIRAISGDFDRGYKNGVTAGVVKGIEASRRGIAPGTTIGNIANA